MHIKQNLNTFYRFIGKKPAKYGALGLGVGFVLFAFDLALATMLQRFFMATGLVTIGTDMPLGVPLQSSYVEASILILIGLIRAATIWGNGFLSGLCQVTVEVEKRGELSAWAINNGGQEIGKVMSYFNDIILGSAASIGNIFYILARFIILAGLIIVMLNYSMSITILVLGLILIIAPLQMLLDKIISKNSKHIQESLANAVSLLSRAIKNNLFISLHNINADEISRINAAVNNYGFASVRYYSISSMRAVFPQFLGLMSVVAIAIYGQENFAGNPALLVAYLYLVLRMFQVLSDIARVSANLRLNYPRISNLFNWWCENIDGQENKSINVSSDNKNLIGWRGENLSFMWDNGHETAIKNLNFNIGAGTTTLIVGGSGTGKTTLFQILLGLIPPTSGALYIIDENGNPTPINGRINNCISYVAPEPFLIAGSVRDQLLIGNNNIADDELIAALNMVGAGFVFDFADGLNHQLTEQGQGLSAGQKQRLALARAIIRKPAILLLDEATANLDGQTEGLIVNLINSLRGRMTILVISHRPHKDLIVDNLIELKNTERNI